MKKIFSFLTIFMFLVLGSGFLTSAVEINVNDHYRVLEQTTTNVFQDITYDHIIAETRTDRPIGWDQGNGGVVEIDSNKWYGQQINVLNIPATNEAQIIPWSVQSEFQWNMMAITDMAKDFEAKHPEYVVLGGVNGDFYDWHNTKDFGQSGTGLEIVGGNMLRYRAGGWNGIAFKKDGTTSEVVYIDGNKVTRSETPVLTIYDESGIEITSILLDKFNTHVEDNETTAYFGRVVGDKGINGYGENTYINRTYQAPELGDGEFFIVENAERVIYQADDKSYYGYGKISTTDKTSGVPKTGFAVATKNPEIADLLSVGTYIRVQYVLTGEYEGLENVIGGKMLLIEDDILPEYTTDSYLTNRAPRTIVGQKTDGSFCLVTMDGRQKLLDMYGTNQEEINAFMKSYGITDAVLLDGGGSSTFFVRENDEFVIKNSPSDTSLASQPRNVGNCLLVVTKRADFTLTNIDITKTSFEFTIDTSKVDFNQVEQIKCTVNGVTKVVEDGKVSFDNLETNKEYQYLFTYDTKDRKDLETMVSDKIFTAKNTPQFGKLKIEIGQNKLIFTPEITDPDEALDYYRIFINNKRNPYLDEPIEVRYTLDGLTQIEFDILVCVDLNDGRGKIEFTQHVVYDLENPTGEIQMENYVEDYLESLNPSEEDPIEEPESGCKKDLAAIVVTMISLSTAVILLKKKNQ